MEYGSVGYKSGNRSNFTSFILGNSRFKHIFIVSINSPFSNPSFQYSSTPSLQALCALPYALQFRLPHLCRGIVPFFWVDDGSDFRIHFHSVTPSLHHSRLSTLCPAIPTSTSLPRHSPILLGRRRVRLPNSFSLHHSNIPPLHDLYALPCVL
jgi:hypothetical protein